MIGKTIHEIKIGDHAHFEKTISETDVYMFAGITGDLNPVHINESIAKESLFQGRIAHGMLVSSLISTVLGMHLPGPGTIYLGQNLRFMAPVKIGDTIKATVTVTEMDLEKNRISVNTICTNSNGKVVVDGTALVMPPKATAL
ncbi:MULTISPECIES: MaoC family dehydratase [unclassified Fusibacter]|uniref:MaoC family dehydratase n=1 Tax=unclassified Fusibacter TaxID=2624464 RepID=UPI001012F237|nr:MULTISPECIES: MaoC family dehydratase [unclassified Fusibacter]MCK8058663.1 MaoC family dehydratase [Fusibacter sp. A2]NPE21738.1 MaoC family dehydratase [Fusibacter sp. A1]RXV61312.1 enoyl-CoA hydratase [Fusibacter sp. A1]